MLGMKMPDVQGRETWKKDEKKNNSPVMLCRRKKGERSGPRTPSS
jgi:hypothetical protein